MQTLVADVRSDLTEADVIALIKTDPTMRVGAGMELLDRDLNVLLDISDNLEDGEVKRSNFATLHASCSFRLTTELAWGSAVVRPYMLVETDTRSARFNLGAYFTNVPDTVTGEDPRTYDVEGYDILEALDTSVGDSYALSAGTDYLAAVQNILENQGYTRFNIDPARTGTTLPTDRGWPMADNVTWLRVVNDLLSAIGYRGIYSDWNGYLVCEPYQNPAERATEWTYDDGEFTAQLGPQQTVKHDYYATPNRWVGVRSNEIEGEAPTEGDGIFIYTNEFEGETSVEARQRTITKRLDIEAADQEALEAAVMRQVANDMSVGTSINADTTPNPLHWHFDILEVTTKEIGTVRVQQTSWTLNLTGGQMQHEWAVI
jgi:hypothetical protein